MFYAQCTCTILHHIKALQMGKRALIRHGKFKSGQQHMLNLDSGHCVCQATHIEWTCIQGTHVDAGTWSYMYVTNKETTIYNSHFEFCCVREVHALFPVYKPLIGHICCIVWLRLQNIHFRVSLFEGVPFGPVVWWITSEQRHDLWSHYPLLLLIQAPPTQGYLPWQLVWLTHFLNGLRTTLHESIGNLHRQI